MSSLGAGGSAQSGLGVAAASEQKFEGLLESAPDAIVIVDEAGTIGIVNGQAEKLFGYQREELIGRPVEVLVPSELRRRHEGHRQDYMADPRTRPMGIGMDLVGRRKDGSRFPVEISLSPLRTEEGLVVTSVIRDISERKRLEQAERDAIRAQSELRTERIQNEMRREFLRRSITAQEDERRRIARELHDETAQALTGVLLGLGRIEAETDLDSASAEAKRLGRDVTEALRELRRIAVRLRPTALDDLGLIPALEQLAQQAPGLPATSVQFDRAARLDPAVEIAIYRIVQEALTNVGRYAEASQVRIELRRRDGILSATIEDDGRGFDPSAVASSGLGLRGMRERAELIGGTLSVESSPGAGTRVILSVPLEGRR